ncbi:unnamed protein product, partial [Didymodactylos carnosus]
MAAAVVVVAVKMVVVGIDVEDANSGLSGNDVTDVTMAGDVDVAL